MIPDDVWNLISNFGLGLTVLIIALFTVVRGDWIPKKSRDREIEILTKSYEDRIIELKAERNEWKEIALRGLDAAESSVEVGKIALKERQKR
jgi:hypothetical protein